MIGYANFRLWVPGGQVPRGWRGGGGGGDKRKDDRSFLPSFMWCHQESNRGHKDFQSFALPTELWHLALDCECKVIAFCRIHQIFSQLFFKKSIIAIKMVVRDGCGGYKGRTFGTQSLIYPQSRHPAWRHAPRMAQPNIPGEVVARLRTTSGVRFYWGILFPACRHAPAWRNTGLRTAAIPCRGLRLPRLSTAPLHCAPSKPAPLHCVAPTAPPRSLCCSTAPPRSLHRSTAPLHCAAPMRCLEARAAARGRKKGVHGGTP